MINDLARSAVASSTCGPQGSLRRPLYGSYCFSRLPATLEYLLTGDEDARARGLPTDVLGPHARRWDTVILLLVDGFGWHLFQEYASRYPFLRRFLDEGVVSPITAQFPSTTAAHVTTLHTGLPPSQSGVHEWYYYEPTLDAVIAPLLYSFAGDHERESLLTRAHDVESILPGPRWYRRLANQGIQVSVHQDERYSGSTYSKTMFAGAKRRGYGTLHGGLTELGDRLLAEQDQRRYVFFYIDGIDGKSHSHGLSSPEFAGQVEATFQRLEERLVERLRGKIGDALLVMSADHGQVSVEQNEAIHVNLALPELLPMLRRNGANEVIRLGGSPRDLFLYVREECLAEAEGRLRELLGGRAEVWRTEGMLAEEMFGPGPDDRLRARLGNLVILPHPGQGVFWLEEGKFAMKHKGSHGGLSPQEMDTGLYVLPF